MTEKKPLVSVVIPTYNRANLIGRAIQSVLGQTYQNFELIVVDDASTDDTKQIVKGFQDDRIEYIGHNKNKGGAAARNTGIQKANGKYIAFLDSDDEWLSTKLEKQLNCFSQGSDSIGAVYCSHYTQDDSLGYRRGPSSNLKKGDLRKLLLSGWCPATTSLFVLPKKVLNESGLFDERLTSFQDYDLWIRVAEYYEFEYVKEPLVIKHQHSGDQIAKDFKPRTKGLELFLKKWGDVIKEEVGEEAYRNIRTKHLAAVHRNAMVSNDRKEMLSHLKGLVKVAGINAKDLIRAFILLLGGKGLFHFVQRVKASFS